MSFSDVNKSSTMIGTLLKSVYIICTEKIGLFNYLFLYVYFLYYSIFMHLTNCRIVILIN